MISGAVTLLLSIVGVINGRNIVGEFSLFTLIDVIIIAILAFGIYKKSRIAAIAMLLYFIFGQLVLRVASGNAAGLPLALVFIYFLFQGVLGTFAYHRLSKV